MKSIYSDESISKNEIIRKFYSNLPQEELLWHRDIESRIISSTLKTNWKIQLEDELPKVIDCEIFIEEGKWHRLIKGDGDLVLKIIIV